MSNYSHQINNNSYKNHINFFFPFQKKKGIFFIFLLFSSLNFEK